MPLRLSAVFGSTSFNNLVRSRIHITFYDTLSTDKRQLSLKKSSSEARAWRESRRDRAKAKPCRLERRKATVENATDINISYRINEQNKAHIISLQAKNIIGREYRGKRYNLKTNTIEEEYFSSIVPFISYRIEF